MSRITYLEFRPGRWVKLVDRKAVGPATPEEVAAWRREKAEQAKIWQDVVSRARPSQPPPDQAALTPQRAQELAAQARLWHDVVQHTESPEPLPDRPAAPPVPAQRAEGTEIWQDVLRQASLSRPKAGRPSPPAELPPLTVGAAIEAARRGRPVVVRRGKVSVPGEEGKPAASPAETAASTESPVTRPGVVQPGRQGLTAAPGTAGDGKTPRRHGTGVEPRPAVRSEPLLHLAAAERAEVGAPTVPFTERTGVNVRPSIGVDAHSAPERTPITAEAGERTGPQAQPPRVEVAPTESAAQAGAVRSASDRPSSFGPQEPARRRSSRAHEVLREGETARFRREGTVDEHAQAAPTLAAEVAPSQQAVEAPSPEEAAKLQSEPAVEAVPVEVAAEPLELEAAPVEEVQPPQEAWTEPEPEADASSIEPTAPARSVRGPRSASRVPRKAAEARTPSSDVRHLGPSYSMFLAGATDDLAAAVNAALSRYKERHQQAATVVLCHPEDLPVLEKAGLPLDVRQSKGVQHRSFWLGQK